MYAKKSTDERTKLQEFYFIEAAESFGNQALAMEIHREPHGCFLDAG
jgi:hypothetical protein